MCREYYLHKRHGGIFYVEFINPENGKKLTARSTGEKDKFKAQVKAELWKANGIPTGRKRTPRSIEEAAGIESIIKVIRKSELNANDALRIVSTLKIMGLIDIAAVPNTGRGAVIFIQFLEIFWDFDKSEYIQDQLAHGFRFTRGHAKTCHRLLKAHLKGFFGDKKLNCVTTDDLEKISKQLADKKLSTSSRKSIMHIVRKPLQWAFEKKIIPENPCLGLTRFSVKNKKRGILTEAEAEAVFSVNWNDNRAYVASLVALTTGARQGECLALRRSDIGDETLDIKHNFSRTDGLKCPKNGEERIVPLQPEVRAALLDLLSNNPFNISNPDKPDYISDPFIFYSLLPDKPCDYKVLTKGFHKAMDGVNLMYLEAAQKQGKEKPEIMIDYKGRNIVFHSLRHYHCTKISEKISGELAAKGTGHKSLKTFKMYADHIEKKNIREIGRAAAQVFGNILQFRKAG
ncbi:MAG: tyrosine-type recombinase/integrase [Treponema sp.]|nr:tyrosine-type recombinase/integrase [Treponema sp.]